MTVIHTTSHCVWCVGVFWPGNTSGQRVISSRGLGLDSESRMRPRRSLVSWHQTIHPAAVYKSRRFCSNRTNSGWRSNTEASNEYFHFDDSTLSNFHFYRKFKPNITSLFIIILFILFDTALFWRADVGVKVELLELLTVCSHLSTCTGWWQVSCCSVHTRGRRDSDSTRYENSRRAAAAQRN